MSPRPGLRKLLWLLLFLLWSGTALGLGLRSRGEAIARAGSSTGTPEEAPGGPRIELARDPARGENLNVVILTLDTTRRDRLGAFGDRAARTPNLDRLASEGVRFDDAVSAAPITLPSHSTIFTGLDPSRHAMHDNGIGALSQDAETLAEMLSRAGYETAAFVSAFVLNRQFGLAQGFRHYDDDVARSAEEFTLLVSERDADATTDAALAWLASRPDAKRNFLLWVHYYDPHFAYAPPSPYRELFPSDPYRGEIAYMDAAIGRLLEEVERSGLGDRTVILALSDHGEGLGDHGEGTHGYYVYDSTMRVPMMMRHPSARDAASPWHARVVTGPVKTADVTPTVLDLVGAEVPASLDGRSLVPVITEEERVRDAGRYGENYENYTNHLWARQFTWREGSWKYIHGAADELYDLAADPGETRDLAASRPEETARLRRELERSLSRAATRALKPAATTVDREAEEKLRSLGYLGGSSGATPDTGAVNLADDETRRDPRVMLPYYDRYFVPANTAMSAGDYAGAARLLREMLAADPGNPLVMLEIAGCEMSINTPESRRRARTLLEELIRAQPDMTKALAYLSEVLRDEGELPAAEALLRRAITLDPQNARHHHALSICLREQDRLEPALAEAREATRLDPGFGGAQFNLALIHDAMQRPDAAAAAYRAALRDDPDMVGALIGLANIRARYTPIGEAIGLYERALVMCEPADRAGILENLGNAYGKLGEPAQAARIYREALALAPGRAQLHYVIGCAYDQLGDAAAARAAWLRALELDPSLEPAKAMLRGGAPPVSG